MELAKIGLTPQGAFNSNNAPYEYLDTVTDNGKVYLSKKDNNTDPLTNTLSWELWVESGEDGIAGTNAQSFIYKDDISNYSELPTSGNLVNDAYYNLADKKLYVFNGTSFPLEGNGIILKGEDGANGTSEISDWIAQNYAEKSLVIYQGFIYRVENGQTASSTDVPGVGDKWVKLNKALEKVYSDDFNPVSGKAVADYVPKKLQSDNLFNRDDAVLDKYFPYYEPGYLYPQLVFDAVGRYITQKITVKPNTKYIKNQGSVGFFDADDRMIIGYPESTLSPITSPANTVCARFTGFQTALETTVFVEGETLISYETGNKTIDRKYLPPSVLSRKGNTIVISKNGGGDYRHINDAMDWLKNNGESDLNNLFTFELLDGNYIESVNMIGLYASIVGRNRENCIVRTYTNDYYNPPFDIAGNNNLSNLTIIADNDGQTTPPLGVNNMPAYGIHYDIAGRYESLGSRVQGRSIVKNCRVIGKHQHAIALGLWQNQYLEIDDTEMYSAEKAAFRAHNYSLTAEAGQQLLVRNCRMSNPRWNAGTAQNPDMQNWAIMLQDPNLAGDTLDRTTIFSFQNNIAWVEGQQSQAGLLYRNSGPLTNPNGETLVGHILHGVDSYGNNISELNF